MNADSQSEILDLTWALVNDRLDVAGLQRLEELVTSNQESRSLYLAAIDLVAGLEWGEVARTSSSLQAPASEEAEAAELFGVELAPRRWSDHRSGMLPRWIGCSSVRSIAVVAAVYYAIAAGLFWSLSLVPHPTPKAEGFVNRQPLIERAPRDVDRATPQERVAVRIIGGKRIRWADSTIPTALGQALPPKRLQLVSGIVELAFDGGARTSVRSPAELEVISGRLLKLQSGTLNAHVPPDAVGFTVETRTAKIVDLGTSFGVSVLPDQSTYVSVLEGKVQLTERFESSHKTGEARILVEGDAHHVLRQTNTRGPWEKAADLPQDHFVSRHRRRSGFALVEQGGTFAPFNLSMLPAANPFATPCLAFPPHSIEALNDGLYGNSSSWIADGSGPWFAGVSFGGRYAIKSIAFGRDNGNDVPGEADAPFSDRCAGKYTLQFTRVPNPGIHTPDDQWHVLGIVEQGEEEVEISSGRYRPHLRHRYTFKPVEATGVRVVLSSPAIAIDELEVYGVANPKQSE